ncbi:PAS domain-containing protein [Marinobacter halodurans]|uniref:PAS domain-containing protein n=1 Tax=Marinobacter halodurans TaxID=2528979 RepID=UPI001F60FC76|nr:PAS domain-containing protein [Marinobacter halodurans]
MDPPASGPSPGFASLAVDHVQEAAYLIGANGRILDANQVACETLGYRREQLLRLSFNDIDPNFNNDTCAPAEHAQRNTPVQDSYHLRSDGERFPVNIRFVPLKYAGMNRTMVFALDVSKVQQLETLRYGILESLTRGTLPAKSLQLIVNYVEETCPEAVASIMLVNEGGTHLEPGPSNRLPARFLDAIRAAPVPIGVGQGACGTAAALKQAVQVEDTANHPYFQACRDIVLDAGFLSCWSTPIISGKGKVLGTFCIYLHTTGKPSETGVKRIARRASHFAAIALERQRAERQVQESHQRYRDIFDNALDALALLEITGDQRLRVLEANPAMERTVGIPSRHMVGKTTDEIATLSQELAARINAHCHQCLARGEMVEGEAWFDLPVGRRILHCAMIPVRRPNGGYHRVVLISRDVTEHRRAEKLLHTREQEFRALVDNSPDGVVRYGADGDTLYINPVLRELIGGADTPYGEVSAALEQRIMPADRCAYQEAWRSVQQTGVEAHLVIRLGGADKRHVRYQDVRFVPEFIPEGNVCSVLAVMRDITALKETEFQLLSLVENSPNYICRTTPSGRLLYVNPALRTWMGPEFDGNAGPGVPPSPWVTPAEHAQLISAHEKAVELDCLVELEIYFSNPQEWHRLLFVPEKNELGDFASVLSVGQDITRQKQVDHELRESRSLLRELGVRREAELEAERKRIAHEIHDELGQLLTTLRLNLSLTGSQLPAEDSSLRQKLNDMTGLVDRTIETVRNIATSLRPAVLNTGVASALEWLTQEFARHSGIHCKLSTQEGIQLDEERATMVFRLVQESLSNVGRHSGADQVWIRLHHYGSGYRLTIRDNGCGFNPEAIVSQQSFGLIGMQERVLSFNGQMTLDSAPGHGTTLRITIPIHPRKAS